MMRIGPKVVEQARRLGILTGLLYLISDFAESRKRPGALIFFQGRSSLLKSFLTARSRKADSGQLPECHTGLCCTSSTSV